MQAADEKENWQIWGILGMYGISKLQTYRECIKVVKNRSREWIIPALYVFERFQEIIYEFAGHL